MLFKKHQGRDHRDKDTCKQYCDFDDRAPGEPVMIPRRLGSEKKGEKSHVDHKDLPPRGWQEEPVQDAAQEEQVSPSLQSERFDGEAILFQRLLGFPPIDAAVPQIKNQKEQSDDDRPVG